MFGLLQEIITLFVCWVETAGIFIANAIISAIAAVITALLLLLPSMPTLPSVPTAFNDGFQYVSYWFPVSYFFTLMATLVTLWLAWLGVAIVLRWGKALSGRA